ncbi:MAG TPA: hypothetical protein VI462_11700 [Acidimicrobiia bacterium]
MADQLDVRHTGDPALVSAFAQMLEEEGLTVDYEPPAEGRSLGVDVAALVIGVTGHPDLRRLAAKAISRFKDRFGGRGNPEIKG